MSEPESMARSPSPKPQQNGARPRILLFTDSFLHGGTERQFARAAGLLDRTKYDVLVGCLRRQGPYLSELEKLGIPIYEFPIGPLYSLRTARLFGQLVRFLRRERIDLLHAFDFYTTVFAVPAAWLARVPVSLASRRELEGLRSPWRRSVFLLACRLATRLVANSQAAAAGLPSAIRALVVHNGIDLAAFRPTRTAAEVRAHLGISPAAALVGLAGNLRPEKDVDTFLRAAVPVVAECPNAYFLVIGDGPERGRLEGVARDLRTMGRVKFLGDRNDVADLLAALDLFVLSSRSESFPNVILEAMALGRPVVATNVGGIPELVVEGQTGHLVPPAEPSQLAPRIVELLKDPERRRWLGENGRTRVERQFTIDHMRRVLEGIYDGLLDGSGAIEATAQPPVPSC